MTVHVCRALKRCVYACVRVCADIKGFGLGSLGAMFVGELKKRNSVFIVLALFFHWLLYIENMGIVVKTIDENDFY